MISRYTNYQRSSLLSTIEGGTTPSPLQSSAANEDDALIDVSSPPREVPAGDKGPMEVRQETVKGSRDGPLVPPVDSTQNLIEAATQQAEAMNDLHLKGVEADLRALQKELLQEFGSSSPPPEGELSTEQGRNEGGGERGCGQQKVS